LVALGGETDVSDGDRQVAREADVSDRLVGWLRGLPVERSAVGMHPGCACGVLASLLDAEECDLQVDAGVVDGGALIGSGDCGDSTHGSCVLSDFHRESRLRFALRNGV